MTAISVSSLCSPLFLVGMDVHRVQWTVPLLSAYPFRCRFAEKLAERYFKMVDQSKEEEGKEEEKKEEKKDMHGLDLLQ